MNNSRVFVCSWDSAGFEAIIDFTDWYDNAVMNALQDKGLGTPPVNITALTMRARFNPHRNPEIWILTTTEDFSEQSLWEYATENPQALADLIRSKGKPLYRNTAINHVIR